MKVTGSSTNVIEILVAFDGSEPALRALHYAIGLAKDNPRVQLNIVFVHEAQMFVGSMTADGTDTALGQAFRDHIHSQLLPAIEAAQAAKVAFTSCALKGETASTIARRADELKCSSIVMGTRGMGALGNLLMGSVASRVVRLSTVPVTLVK